MLRLLLVICAFSCSANSQWLSIGVTGGVPVSPYAATYSSATILLNPSPSNQPGNDVIFQAPNDLYQKSYAVGPTLELNFPWNGSLEAGMLYERFHRDASEGITPIRGDGVDFGYISSTANNAFLVPLPYRNSVICTGRRNMNSPRKTRRCSC